MKILSSYITRKSFALVNRCIISSRLVACNVTCYCLACGLFLFEKSLNTLKAEADCPQKRKIGKDTVVENTLISKSRHAFSEVHSNLSYQWVKSDELLLWARFWCQSHVNPHKLHCSNWQHSRFILMGLRSDLPSAKKLFWLIDIPLNLNCISLPFPSH